MKKKIVILGGGLWGGLLAANLQKVSPELDFLLVESGSSFGGNHTWSFHLSDLDAEQYELIKPFVAHTWDGYSVQFPEYERDIDLPYRSVTSDKFHKTLLNLLPVTKYRLNKRMTLEEAQSLGEIVLDCRGSGHVSNCGYQKFVGLKIKTKSHHGIKRPVLMDSSIQQIDGFRFMYVLPLDEKTLLVEDTRYSQDSSLDHFRIREKILEYIAQKNWELDGIESEESGVLPIPFDYTDKETSDLSLGNIFHDVTGYSLPDAVRLIQKLSMSDMSADSYARVISDYKEDHKSQREFFCFLNRLMFQVAGDDERYKMLSFFYRKNLRQISRFYAQKMTSFDKVMFFAGKPPVSIKAAARYLFANPPFSGRPSYESDF